jgi:DNA-directed RNA polymerase I, II, and III subunit RPABC3
MVQNTLFEDTFLVESINKDGKKFDRVSRIEARSESYNVHLVLDVNTQIYAIAEKQRLALLLTPTLHDDAMGEEDEDVKTWNPRMLERSKADDYEYVMFGKVYKAEEAENKMYIFVSPERFVCTYSQIKKHPALQIAVRLLWRAAHVHIREPIAAAGYPARVAAVPDDPEDKAIDTQNLSAAIKSLILPLRQLEADSAVLHGRKELDHLACAWYLGLFREDLLEQPVFCLCFASLVISL